MRSLRSLNKRLASQYDTYYEFQSRAKANLIQRALSSITEDSQIIDIGGGTAQVSLLIHDHFNMTNPVVCVDPSQDMLDIAYKKGAITIQSSAESFFASQPDYPLRIVLMNACVHLFDDPDFIFSKLAEYMPEDGVCIATEHVGNSLPLFKAADKQVWGGISAQLESFSKILESHNLKWRVESGSESNHISKKLWFEGIRSRFSTGLLKFSDKELEEGIQELEERLKDIDVLDFIIGTKVYVITKQ